MEDFIVSARKYRPERFDAVVGQHSIAITLKNSIRDKHLGHAYLFCGPRGIGKTTCARIFAKAINCMAITPETEACNNCESCRAFNENRAFNIHELDAASSNSVDDIRNLTDRVRIPPQVGRYSIYIIDEAHMLSAQAFNAFLKTLEEPPPHAVFILATTEKHKILPTILSRCQIFDFNRIKVTDIVGYLGHIANAEQITYEDDALGMIARKADGAMRDALSIFDQMVSFSGRHIKYIDVINNLNILDFEYYFTLTREILNGDVSKLLLILDEILLKGFDEHNFLDGLTNHFRDLLVCKDPITAGLLEQGEGIRERYREQSIECSVEFLYKALDIASQTDMAFRLSKNHRLLIELFLIRLSGLGVVKKKQQLKQDEPGKVLTTRPESGLSEVPGSSGVQQTGGDRALSTDGLTPTHSIRNVLNNNYRKRAEENQTVDTEPEPRMCEFGQDQLNEKWLEFADKIKSDRPRMYSFLRNHTPLLKENWRIEVTFNNSAQLDLFNSKIKTELKEYLSEALDNNRFLMIPRLPENKDDTRQLYTQEEKYDHLLKKNPALGRLKEDFNMDFE